MRNADAHRVALLRDLLLDYPTEQAPNHGEPPEGLTPEEQDAWAEEQALRNAPGLPLEGQYIDETGAAAAQMVPMDSGAWDDVQGMREYLNPLMPRAGEAVPEDPYEGPSRAHALARMLRRG